VLTVALAFGSSRLVEAPIRRWANQRLEAAVVRPAPRPAAEKARELVTAR
jgi:peptidoglycan/LPS O-acetylase OafA/YrhL